MFSRVMVTALVGVSFAAPAIAQDAPPADPPLADPMRPALRTPGVPAAARTSDLLRLQGTVIAASRKLALIDGEFLEEGQQIYGARIERIDRDAVTVRRNGKTFVLRPESAPAESAAEPGETR